MTNVRTKILNVRYTGEKHSFLKSVQQVLIEADYHIVEEFFDKPWGGMFRMDSSDAPRFIADFFDSSLPLDTGQAQVELSPKLLFVEPGQRLSWQYHEYRSEIWSYLSDGAYRRGLTDAEGERVEAQAGTVIQLAKGERHRLEGAIDRMTIVAEIWQHSDKGHPSDEDDIIRLLDDYRR